jgi:hypothetical protein
MRGSLPSSLTSGTRSLSRIYPAGGDQVKPVTVMEDRSTLTVLSVSHTKEPQLICTLLRYGHCPERVVGIVRVRLSAFR